ncbi:MAG: lipoyl synthase [Spirochaetaceae bacterium]|nr:lipoyl synthase [Spirochaetaceae bacterium]
MPPSPAPAPSPAALRKPAWLRVALPSGDNWKRTSELLRRRGLHTVCDEARCPNKAECWGQATATFMIMGAVCTRGCRFCAVATARAGEPLRPEEPAELAEAVAELGLKYAVITSVDRDDLPDRGAGHFAQAIRAVLGRNPGVRVEALTPDYAEGEIEAVLDSGPAVFAHNIEVVERLQRVRDARASYAKSLRCLELAARDGRAVVKSSIMLGLGETEAEVLAAMDDLRRVGCSSLVLGQYLRPTPDQLEVSEYLPPEAFARLAGIARGKGFVSVVAAPLARTSYHARAGFEEARP